jgi:hypothetical protein
MTAQDLALFRIYAATEVPAGTSETASAGVGISYAQAVGLAEAEWGRSQKDIRVLRAAAVRYLDQPAKDVWVVLFETQYAPLGGPPGSEELPPRPAVAGVLIDSETGEVWGGFIR